MSDLGEDLGETPVSISKSSFLLRVIKLSHKGKAPYFLTLLPESKGDVDLILKLQPGKDPGPQYKKKPVPVPIAELKKTRLCPTTPKSPSCRPNRIQKTDFAKINEINRYLIRAMQSFKDNNFEKVLSISKDLEKKFPALSAPKILMALSSIQNGNLNDAKKYLNSAKKLDPGDTEVRALLKALE